MADTFSKEKRSAVMRGVRSNGNKSTEVMLITIFRELGITGWKRGYPVKGHPDFVFLEKWIAVFVDGCFWHGHDCRNTRPRNNEAFWTAKREKNQRHDFEVTALFEARHWTMIRIWECELGNKKRAELIEKLRSNLLVNSESCYT